MVSISDHLNATTVSKYFRTELASSTSNYYGEHKELRGDYYGNVAPLFGLEGRQVTAEAFDRLALGQHPITGEQLIKHRASVSVADGKEVAHRAGWDLSFSPSKSVSVTALVGGDTRIIDAHRAAVKEALAQVERLIQARMGGRRAPQTTGKCIIATFEHDTARPVDRYSACQLHTHGILLNMTEDATGKARSIDPREVYKATGMISAVYQNSLERALRAMGYKLEHGKNHAPEIVGYTPEYLASESKRSKQIEEELERRGVSGAAAAHIAAHSTRAEKLEQTAEEVKAAHSANALRFGNQPQQVVATVENKQGQEVDIRGAAKRAVDFGREKLSERTAVFDHHEVMREALRHVRGGASRQQIEAELERQKADGRFIAVSHVRRNAPLWRYTTPELIADERRVLAAVRSGRHVSPMNLVSDASLVGRYPDLNDHQRRIVRESLGAEEQITGIQGGAGTGKTTSISALRELATESGWKVYGLAPTSGAAKELKAAGVGNAETLQRFLVRTEEPTERKRLFFVDESSLVAARQMRQFVERLQPSDRVVICGDIRQHDSVGAGRIFEELQTAGMKVVCIDKIVRQKDPALKAAVEAMAEGRIAKGVGLLTTQGRVTEVQKRKERYAAIAADYAGNPVGTLVISPDNLSRQDINTAIRAEMQKQNKLGPDVFKVPVLVNRQQITGADRAVAGSYEVKDVLLYRTGSKTLGIKAKEYATVIDSDRETNQIMVKLVSGKVVTYDPSRLRGVSIYQTQDRCFAVGDRIQFTSPSHAQAVTNREMGRISTVDENGNARVKLDSGRTVGFSLQQNRHVDHAYCSTSHAAQGITVDRAIIHVATGDTRVRSLVSDTLAYVAISRPRYDARIYTDNSAELARSLSHHQENATALSNEQVREYRKKKGMAA